MAGELVQWMGVGGRTQKDMAGQERAKHAAHIVSVLNRSDKSSKMEELRRIAVHGGFLSAPLRQRVWPLLLNIQSTTDTRQRDCASAIALEHRENKQVQLDVVRSMTHFAMRRDEREARLKQLSRVIDSVLAANPTLHYYQGYNDVCSVAIMVMDQEEAARQVSEQLARYHLREAMNPTMAAVQQALNLMMLVLKRRDKELYTCLRACEVEPVFAISWIITWFAHDLKSLSQVERLYDFFLASHPLMSLYFSASLLSWQRARLLKTQGDYAAVHQIMQELPRDLPLSILIHDAYRLFQQAPPTSILAEAAANASPEPIFFSNESMWVQYPYKFQTEMLEQDTAPHPQILRRTVGGWVQSVFFKLRSGAGSEADEGGVREHALNSIKIVWDRAVDRRGIVLLRTVLAGGGIALSLAVVRLGGPASAMRAVLSAR